jgi:hypothetical protein
MLIRIAESGDALHAVRGIFDGEVEADLELAAHGVLYGVPVGVKDRIAFPRRTPRDNTDVASPAIPAGVSAAVGRLRCARAWPLLARRSAVCDRGEG